MFLIIKILLIPNILFWNTMAYKALDMRVTELNVCRFLYKCIYYRYSLEAPLKRAFNEYLQQYFYVNK